MKKIYCFFLAAFFCAFTTNAQVVINEVYGGGGNSGSTYRNDFIELYNRGTEAVSLNGWSVQYASATGTSWQKTDLSGTIPAGGYYLIQQAAGTGGTQDLPAPNATGNIPMSGTAGKVALVNNTTPLTVVCPTGAQIVDFVGFGTTANCFEGTGPTPAPSNTNSVQRTPIGTDTNNNNADFTSGAPSPTNSAPVGDTTPPVVTATTPADGATDVATSFTASLTFNEAIIKGSGNILVKRSADNAIVQTITVAATTVSGSTATFSVTGLSNSTRYYIDVPAGAFKDNADNEFAGSSAWSFTTVGVAPTASVAAGSNGAEGGANGTFIITLSAPAPAGGTTLTYTLGGTATSGTDYTDAAAGTVTIAAGATTATITLAITDDAATEGTETITVMLTGSSSPFILGNATAGIDVIDNDIAPYIALSSSYTQNFNSLSATGTGNTWTDNETINGWYSSRTTYNAANGSSNTGALYSFGSTGSTERALGSVGSGSTSTIYYGARFKNTGTTAITRLQVSYTGEQWRNGGVTTAQTVNFAYQTGATSLTGGSWTAVTGLNFSSPVNVAPAATLDGNAAANSTEITYTITGLNIAPGEEFMLRWEDIDHSGSDHGLAIDDLVVEANPIDLVAPTVTGLFPAAGATDVSTNLTASITFDETVEKGTGSLYIKRVGDNALVQTINMTSATVTVNGASLSVTINGLAVNTGYYIEVENGAVKDPSGNAFTGISGTAWSFTTGATFYVANFNSCTAGITDGFMQFNVTGAAIWACTPFGRDPEAPAGSAAYPNGVQINGFTGGTNVPNVDWLISPSLDLTGTTYPLLSFWSRTAFNGLPLVLKVSTDYTGGDPSLATWTELNGKFPQQASNIWTLSSGINLSAYKGSNVHIAFVYTSTDDDGARWTLDDVRLENSATPPPPSITVNTTDIQFGFVASGSTADKTIQVTGNDLTGGLTVTSSGAFLIAKEGGSFGTSLSFTKEEANNNAITVQVRFAPTAANQNFTGTIEAATSGLTATVSAKGTSIDPATTLEVVNWNIEWFGSASNGPTNDSQQEQNVRNIFLATGADVYALTEIVSEERLASVVSGMPGYAYVISNYSSHTNTTANPPSALAEAQKLAFVYKTSVLSNVTTTALLSQGINSAADLTNPAYSYWSSGRFPYMLSADVTLNCVTKPVRFVLVHGKANTSPTATSYDRRKKGADTLHYTLQQQYPNDNIIMLGDFNDDLDQSITAGFTTTSWSTFTTDSENFSAPTLSLSLAGKKSTVSYNDVIDHVIVSNEMQQYYMSQSANILTDVTSLVSNYGSTTSDHYPVFTRYQFEEPAAPVVTSCPVVAPFCATATGTYTVPQFTAQATCGSVTYTYIISGATTRSGSGNNASGTFNVGTSIITWMATDALGKTITCQTTVVVNAAPVITIPDAFTLPAGVLANTVYIGYAPASTLSLQAVTTTPGTYTYNWSTGSTTAATAVSPTSATAYTVTVTDGNGCVGTASKTIAVMDVRAGKNDDKVMVCHKQSHEIRTLEIDAVSVADHLAHGDMLGSCGTSVAPAITIATAEGEATGLSVKALPNPSAAYFAVTIEGNATEKVSLRVTDIAGRTIEQQHNVPAGKTVQLGSQYRPGVYVLEVIKGNTRKQVQLIKTGN